MQNPQSFLFQASESNSWSLSRFEVLHGNGQRQRLHRGARSVKTDWRMDQQHPTARRQVDLASISVLLSHSCCTACRSLSSTQVLHHELALAAAASCMPHVLHACRIQAGVLRFAGSFLRRSNWTWVLHHDAYAEEVNGLHQRACQNTNKRVIPFAEMHATVACRGSELFRISSMFQGVR